MGDIKLKVRLSGDEFDGEGPEEIITQQYADFLKARTTSPPPAPAAPNPLTGGQVFETPIVPSEQSPIAKISRADGRLVTLTALPQGENRETNAALLLLLGQRILRQSELVPADDLIGGMRQSGFGLDRADRLMSRAEADGLITKTGLRRGVRYRLTNPGIARAEALARELASTVS